MAKDYLQIYLNALGLNNVKKGEKSSMHDGFSDFIFLSKVQFSIRVNLPTAHVFNN